MMSTTLSQVAEPRRLAKAVAIVAIGFGLATVISGGNVLFGAEATRELAGDYVPFVLWFNFLAGFFYIVAGAGIWMARDWAMNLSSAIFVATTLVAAAFGFWVLQGGAFEMRTVGALVLRAAIWAIIVITLFRARRS